MSLFSRTDRSPLGQWWWTVDRTSLGIVCLLMGLGLVLIMAASPAVAALKDLGSYHFVARQAIFAVPALAIIVALSMLSLDQVRRTALVLLCVSYVLLLGTLLFGTEIKGAQRWLSVGSFAIQPSEFLKPAFVILLAYGLSERAGLAPLKRYGIAVAAWALIVVPLILQPDFGQTALITLVWMAMLFLAGLPWLLVCGIAAASLALGVLAYLTVAHVAERVNGFLDPGSVDNYQVEMALKAIESGGLLGRGIGAGTVKDNVPDAHADFIFAVAGEEFGFLFCLLIVALFAIVVVRGLFRSMRESDHFVQLAAAGLVMLIGLQAFINLGVNVRLLPAKGMTLPFISYGGSSLLALAVTTGLLLALTRRRLGKGLPRRLPLGGRFM